MATLRSKALRKRRRQHERWLVPDAAELHFVRGARMLRVRVVVPELVLAECEDGPWLEAEVRMPHGLLVLVEPRDLFVRREAAEREYALRLLSEGQRNP